MFIKKIFIITFLILVLNSIFNISEATSSLNNVKWNLYFDNIKVTEGSVEADEDPVIMGDSKSEIEYSVNLNLPGDFYEFTVDVINAGTIDAMVSEANSSQLTKEQERFLLHKVTYADGSEVKPYDKLEAGKIDTLRVRLEYRKDITADDLPKKDTTISLSLNAYYIQADDNAKEREENIIEPKQEPEEPTIVKNTKTITKVIVDVMTGDNVVKYIILLVLAVIVLLITNGKVYKNNDEDSK